MCDHDDYLMEHFEPSSDDKLGFNSNVEEYEIFKKYTYLKKIATLVSDDIQDDHDLFLRLF